MDGCKIRIKRQFHDALPSFSVISVPLPLDRENRFSFMILIECFFLLSDGKEIDASCPIEPARDYNFPARCAAERFGFLFNYLRRF